MEEHAIVIESGRYCSRIGWAGEDTPSTIFPTAEVLQSSSCTPSSTITLTGGSKYTTVAAQAAATAAAARAAYAATCLNPETDKEASDRIEAVVSYLLKQNHIPGLTSLRRSQHPVLLTDNARSSRNQREILTQLMFEQFNVPAMGIANEFICALFAHGKTTGLVVDIGHYSTQIGVVNEGALVPYTTNCSNIAGYAVSEHFTHILAAHGRAFAAGSSHATASSNSAQDETMTEASHPSNENNNSNSSGDHNHHGHHGHHGHHHGTFSSHHHQHMTTLSIDSSIINLAKESLCAVSTSGVDTHSEKSYELPDGHVIHIGARRFDSSEILFHPSSVLQHHHSAAIEGRGLHELACDSILRCDPEIRRDVSTSVLLCGGTSMIDGLPARLQSELSCMLPSSTRPVVVAPAERKNLIWMGAAILASLQSFQPVWVSKSHYDEVGPSAIHRMSIV